MTDSRSERPIPTEPADPQAMTRRDAQGAAPDPPVATSSQATAKGRTASERPFVWDGGLISEDDGPGAPPASPVAERAQAGPAESKRSSLRRLQWIGGAAEKNAADGGDGGSAGDPPEGPEGGSRGRGGRVGLVFIGALAVAGLLVWAITSTLPKSGPKASVAAAGTASASPTHALQPLGASPIAVLSDSARPSPSATRITLPAAPHTTTASQRPATVKTTAATTAPASTAPAAPTPQTTDVQIADSANGLVLDVDNSGTTSGTLVGTWSVDGTPAQHWHLVAQPNGSYVVYSELADLKEGLEINTDANDFNGNTATTLQSYTGNTSMQWTAKYLGSNKYELVSGYNGQCLTGAGQGVANATIACDTSDAHQAWTITG